MLCAMDIAWSYGVITQCSEAWSFGLLANPGRNKHLWTQHQTESTVKATHLVFVCVCQRFQTYLRITLHTLH